MSNNIFKLDFNRKLAISRPGSKVELSDSSAANETGYHLVVTMCSSRAGTRVSEYKSMDVSKEIYYSVPFLACKMAAAVHTRPELELSKEGRTVRSGRSSC